MTLIMPNTEQHSFHSLFPWHASSPMIFMCIFFPHWSSWPSTVLRVVAEELLGYPSSFIEGSGWLLAPSLFPLSPTIYLNYFSVHVQECGKHHWFPTQKPSAICLVPRQMSSAVVHVGTRSTLGNKSWLVSLVVLLPGNLLGSSWALKKTVTARNHLRDSDIFDLR